jgi:hypothetical protein
VGVFSTLYKKDGLSQVFQNNILIGESTFKKDKLEGVSKIFTEEGLVREYSTFKKGVQEGLTVTYSEEVNTIGSFLAKKGEIIAETCQFRSWENPTDTIEQRNLGFDLLFKELQAA